MAIIQCPCCKKEVSTSSNKCIHCGTYLTICPKCGYVHTRRVDVCAECGYQFESIPQGTFEETFGEATQTTQETDNQLVKKDNVFEDFKHSAQNSAPKILITFGLILKVLFAILAMTPMLIAIINLATDKTLKVIMYLKKLDLMLAISAVILFISVILNEIGLFMQRSRFANYLITNKIDLEYTYKNYRGIAMQGKKQTKDFNTVMLTINEIHTKSRAKGTLIWGIISGIVGATSLGLLFTSLIRIIIKMEYILYFVSDIWYAFFGIGIFLMTLRVLLSTVPSSLINKSARTQVGQRYEEKK